MLRTRVITALVLLAGFMSVLFLLPHSAGAVAFAVLAGLMAWEWSGLMKMARDGRPLFVGVILLSCLFVYHQSDDIFPKLWLASAVFWLVAVPLWLWRGWRMASNDMAAYVTGWLLIVPTWAAMVALLARNPWWLLGAMALAWVADTAAYFAGRAYGRHKLAPTISPGKTWEGVAGGVAGVLVYGVAVAMMTGIAPLDHSKGLLLLAMMTGVSVLGDLFESMIKRQAGVKDSGHLLPGHGGFLDRLDSQTSTLPLIALILLVAPP